MVKRLALIVAVLSLITPFSVFALGLGSIDMQSTLNQRLDARIELLRVRPGELKALEVALASADTFQRAGIERPAFLARIKFDLVRPASGGKPYIHLTSSQPITEPFLNFLIEVNWANGRLLREFTVLVDPPVLSAERKQRPIQAPATARRAPAPRSAPPARQRQSVTRSVPAATRPAPRVSTTESGGVNYGPTRRGDTLWEIAEQMRPDSSVSVPQMMMAILESNPNAFYGGNINNLKMGHVLRMDDSGAATSISSGEAARMASLQFEEWKENRGMMGSTPSRTRSAATRSAPDGARVKLVSPGAGEDGTGTPRSIAEGSDAARLNEELSLAQEALDATRQETKEMSSQMAALSDQIETMKRLVMLKDNQLVALQSQLKEAGQTPDMPEVTEQASPEAASAMEAEAPATEQLAAEAEVLEGSADEQAEMEAILSAEGGESQVVDPEQLATEESATEAPVDMAAGKESDIMATLMALPARFMSDFKVMGIGIALILIIGGFVWMFVRRRKLQEFQESILTGQSSVGEGEAAADMPSEDASFMSDFAVSSMEGIQAEVSDVDPISEADVYLAYGRYKQAEELINSAIESDPERADLKLKALEIHFSAKDKDAFELQAEMFKDSLSETEHWAKVTEMGQELCPENDMFSGDVVTSSADTASDDIGDLDFNDSEFADLSTEDSSVAAVSAEDEPGEIDFGDSEFADLSVDSSTGEDQEAEHEISGLDFDLGMDDEKPAVEDTVAEIAETTEAADDDNSLDFDLGDFKSGASSFSDSEAVDMDSDASSFTDSEAVDIADETSDEIEDNSLDFDLGSFETEESTDSGISADAGEDELVTAEADDNSLDFDLTVDDTPVAEVETESEASMEITDEDMESELDESLFADVDEVGTKLDLAKAYIDMGDSDGAKSILDEVLQEGDDTQKNEAEGLMAQMA